MNKIVKELRALIQPHGVISLASPDLFEEAAAQIELQHAALHSLFCAVCMNFPDWMIEAKELGDEVRHALCDSSCQATVVYHYNPSVQTEIAIRGPEDLADLQHVLNCIRAAGKTEGNL